MRHRMSVMASVAVSQVGMTEVIFVNHGVKVNGQYYCDVRWEMKPSFDDA